ncbi:LLM class flavin-dependent oxidoreductase [Tsuneonella sp. CC-YZS046]|uniref:LLM class flavin-dependent oxidoreductase n=1 Tax=Tsuneonella sp. CC-YZS046 TaxID=3042152 RepID=UPI002D780EF0|nr:LLM class flavin-dependent oxidoreductase [Tsuneonella sp. CC-YZS046]WRO67790.1 LLM class flavin-dependent oxidoreductase [Tsuneonella sp. CC-YZS046]
MTNPRQIHLATFIYPFAQRSSWRHPDVQADMALDIDYYRAVTKVSEDAKFDAVFLADSYSGDYPIAHPEARARLPGVSVFEPLSLMSVLSAHSEKIGLIYTAGTTYEEPYMVARALASLDHLSKGRAGWNLVTTKNPKTSANFGKDEHMLHGERYRRAAEFLDVVKGLWDSFEDDAFVLDKEAGIYFDIEKSHTLDHQGEFFSVAGPLRIARPPQGHPVVSQAGSSESGRDLGARTADIIFTAHQTLEDGQDFYRDVKQRAAAAGRDPSEVLILPGASVIWGETDEIAWQRHEEMQALIHPDVGLRTLESICGVDLSGYPLDGPLPDLPETNESKSQQQVAVNLARREGLTIRQLYLRVANSYRHHVIVGSTRTIADDLEQWFTEGAADGFVLFAPYMLKGFTEFATHVVPELQRRGLFRKEYEGSTLREHLGLARPANRYATQAASTARLARAG